MVRRANDGSCLGSSIGDLDDYSGLNVDGRQLLDVLGHGVDIDDALVDTHLQGRRENGGSVGVVESAMSDVDHQDEIVVP